ncbi:MAG TPA: YifB family Mg chelatase-like AAA ATPase [Vicinamibacterales bacterium]|nr:YifB family Mg chelatase-like AAA ATPase [Vicinamibacterales bacterium]
MLACIRSAAVYGIDAAPVTIEVDVSFGLPGFTVVGLPDASVRESRDRIKSAIRNSGFTFPPHRVIVNLAPADLRKAGSSFDLPIALGVLAAAGAVLRRDVDDVLVLGELSLDGAIQSARGVLPVAAAARARSFKGLLLPQANSREAAIVEGIDFYPVRTLREAVAAINQPAPVRLPPEPDSDSTELVHGDFADVRGQLLARRAIEIAAAGGHNVLLSGAPGSGKTMMARRTAGILPPLTFDEALEVTAIHSVAGLLPVGRGLLRVRPFRAPHHTISDIALVGGGSMPRPGEISLAHHGVLFLDEMPEFSRHVLEVLRQPLEDGMVRIARAQRTCEFPARFVLIGAMNPCPCGYFGDERRVCRCTPQQIARYESRLSGPLRDRIDLAVGVSALPPTELAGDGSGEPTAAIRARVESARAIQSERSRATGVGVNARLSPRILRRVCGLDDAARRLLAAAAERFNLSARAYDRVLRVSRTIGDLAGADAVGADHVAEALQYR